MMGWIIKILAGYLIIAIPVFIIIPALCKASAMRDKEEKELIDNYTSSENQQSEQ